MRKITRIVIHCAATPEGRDVKAVNIVAGHLMPASKGGRGWSAPGYHYIVELSGRVVNTWPEGKIANGVKGYNADSIHVCYIGGVDAKGKPKDTRTPQQRASLRSVISELKARYPGARVLGHRDLSPDRNGNGVVEPSEWLKACPSYDVRAEEGG